MQLLGNSLPDIHPWRYHCQSYIRPFIPFLLAVAQTAIHHSTLSLVYMAEGGATRWAMLILFAGFSASSGAFWCTYAPIASQAAEYYGVAEAFVNLFEMSFLFMYFPTAPLTSWMLNKSLYWSLFVAFALNAIGSLLRYSSLSVLSLGSFPFALASQFLLASVNCMALVASSTVAEAWFPSHEKVLSTTIASLSNFLGVGVGMLLPVYVKDLRTILVSEAAIAAVLCALYILLARKEPYRFQVADACFDICGYVRKRKSIAVVVLSGAAIGTSYTLIGLSQQILSASGYSTVRISWVGLVFVAGGLCGSLAATWVVESNGSCAQPLRWYMLAAICVSVGQCVMVQYKAVFMGLTAGLGFGLVGFVPMAIRKGVDDAFPLDESVPTNIMFSCAQIFSLMNTYPVLYFQAFTGLSGMWAIAICVVFSFGPLFFLCSEAVHKSEMSMEMSVIMSEKYQ